MDQSKLLSFQRLHSKIFYISQLLKRPVQWEMKHRQMLKACQRYSDTYQKNRSIDREVELETNTTSTNITLILDSPMYQCRSREIWHHSAPIPGPKVHCVSNNVIWGKSLCIMQSGCDSFIRTQSSPPRNVIFREASAVSISKQHWPTLINWLDAFPDAHVISITLTLITMV